MAFIKSNCNINPNVKSLMLKLNLKTSEILFIALLTLSLSVNAQQHKDSIMAKQTALRNNFITKIKTLGYAPSLKAPEIILDNPRSFGNYDDEKNILHTCDWTTFPTEGKAVFDNFAINIGHGMTGKQFFDLAVYQWIFIHEMGHWWRACQHQTTDPYENEKAANRIAAAYWLERAPAFYKLMLSVFNGVVDHSPSPVPAGQSKEKYLDDNYDKLPGGAAYSWYQSVMNVEIGKEKLFETFKQAIERSGKPL